MGSTMRSLAIAVSILVPAVSGCVSSKDDPAPPTDGAGGAASGLPALEIPWGLTDCKFLATFASVPSSVMAPYLPPGWRSLSLQELGMGGAPNPRGDANFGIEAFQCRAGAGLNGTLPGLAYASYYSAVEPPAAFRRQVNFHFLKWDVLVPDDARRDVLRTYGVPAVNGTTAFARHTAAGSAYAVEASFALNGSAQHQVSGVLEVPADPGKFVEYTPVPGGFANWSTDYVLSGGGIGPVTLQAAPNTLAAKILGTAQLQGVGFGGIVTFKNAKIELPATPAS